jgi:hypothetical protein
MINIHKNYFSPADPFIEIMSPSDGDIRPEELEYPCRVQYI